MLISFILPAYKMQFLASAIQSILDQEYGDFELIVIDDHSPEDLRSVVEAFDDSRIQYRNERNFGGTDLVGQWSKCIQFAKGKYLILADDDDLYTPTFLTEIIRLIKKYPGVDLLRSRVELINDRGDMIGIDNVMSEYISQVEFTYNWLRGIPFICIGNYVFRTKVIQEKLFDQLPFAFGSDITSVLKMAAKGMVNTCEMLFKFRISSFQLSSDTSKYSHKIDAISKLYKMVDQIDYPNPQNAVQEYCYHEIQWEHLYRKCIYDYYNVAVKYLPFKKMGLINSCVLLKPKDKYLMYARFIIDKVFKR
ncbi:glycosyltransferase family 2 protein [Sphingobacterium lactis]|uniref:Glycosyltransferase involved in cell wall bisynthesis n=1 Tax=Sphingobacterium lactis TaxID=797291 RepID=A0A1H6CL52_9SPHI|nr:glycosyltransferase family 2 protein [Sphingobacterium lactis]SEG73443.1 Glycosyltransferase involved in cell wall bisynthesis [Sphingobacterium lactis]